MAGYGQKSERFTSTAGSIKKIEDDLKKLYKCGRYKVFLDDENIYAMSIQFKGPKDTPYENGYWRLNLEVSNEYPFKSPSVGFANRIYHPNIDFESGTICLDVLNSRWTPMYGLKDIVEWMIPGLLKEPNASDPLNSAAARLKAADEKEYERKVRQYVVEYASKTAYNNKFYPNGVCNDLEDHLYYVSEVEEEDGEENGKDKDKTHKEINIAKNGPLNKKSFKYRNTNSNGSFDSFGIDQQVATINGTNKTATTTTIAVQNSNGYSALLEKTMHTLSDNVNKLDQYHHTLAHSEGKEFFINGGCDSSMDDNDDDDDDSLSDIDISDTDLMECEN